MIGEALKLNSALTSLQLESREKKEEKRLEKEIFRMKR